ncbi:MAG: phenylacetate--CoA ligase family protein [Candidatus Hodarchaeales archaeon]|jgi:phenylacetate-CoA ligase
MINKFAQFGIDALDLLRSHDFSYNVLFKLKKIQYYPKEKLHSLVKKRVERLLSHSYHNVPYYRELLSGKEMPPETFSKINLSEIPVSTKDVLRKNFPDKVQASVYNHRAIYNTTSGSTGEPFEFYNDVYAFPHRQASFMLFNTWMGVKPHDKHVALKSPGPMSFKDNLRDRIFSKNRVSVLDVNRKGVKNIVNKINAVKPVYLEGYTASLVNLARYIEEMGLDLSVNPRAIIATSEDLVESHRGLLERVFSTHVFNRYGSREFCGAVAQECCQGNGLHINNALCHLEVVDKDGQPVAEGERGKVLVTDLTNFVMPFIRYDIGDTAIRGPDNCACGLTLPMITGLVGREGQFIESMSGEKIPFITISAWLFRRNYAPHVFSYQFEQMKPGQLLLRVVPTGKFDADIQKKMFDYLEEALPDFHIEVITVEDIPATRSGKRPFLITSNN